MHFYAELRINKSPFNGKTFYDCLEAKIFKSDSDDDFYKKKSFLLELEAEKIFHNEIVSRKEIFVKKRDFFLFFSSFAVVAENRQLLPSVPLLTNVALFLMKLERKAKEGRQRKKK